MKLLGRNKRGSPLHRGVSWMYWMRKDEVGVTEDSVIGGR